MNDNKVKNKGIRTAFGSKPPGKDLESGKATDEELALLSKALSHPVRIQILRFLAEHEACVCGSIVEVFPLAQSTVSEHLRILKEAGFILGELKGQRVCYCINTETLARFKSLVNKLPESDVLCSSTDCKEDYDGNCKGF